MLFIFRELHNIQSFEESWTLNTDRLILNQTKIWGSRQSLSDVTYLGGQIQSETRPSKSGFIKIQAYD